MAQLLLASPLWLSTLLIVSASALIAAIVPIWLRRWIPHERIRVNNEVGGLIYSTLGLLYGVVLGLIVLFCFEDHNRARIYVDNEAGQVVDLFRLTAAYPEQNQAQFRAELLEYARTMVGPEWERMARGENSLLNEEAIHALWHSYTRFAPNNLQQQVALQASLSHLGELADARRLRISTSRTSIPGFMWFVLILGGAIILAFSFFFAGPNVKAQSVMSSLLASMTTLTLLLLFQIDHVYDGRLAISSEPFQIAIEQMKPERRPE